MSVLGFFSIILILVVFSGTLVFGVITSVVNPVKRQLKLIKPLSPRLRKILVRNFPYYNNLNQLQKKDFEKRLKYFLSSKQFIPRNMDEITEEMKLMVGACAVQLTFGYQPIKLAHFKKIILYPTSYYSRFSKRTHKGEVNPNGMIVLSWEDFLKGYKFPNDGYNVGLHEMAHALRVADATHDEEYAFIDDKYLAEWHKVTMREIRKIKRGKSNFLRPYAATNQEEFFAVCIEQFFEQPYQFKQELPEVYKALAKLLNQDPTDLNGSEGSIF